MRWQGAMIMNMKIRETRKENIFENAKDALCQLSANKELQSTIALQHACLKQYDKNR
jgi:hypothetical protein